MNIKYSLNEINKMASLNVAALVIRFLSTLIFAIAVPWISGFLLQNQLKPLDQLYLGVLVFISLTVVGFGIDIARLRQKGIEEFRTSYIRDGFDQILANIRKSHDELIRLRRLEPDMYTAYFHKSLQQFEQRIYDAATKQELIVNELHFSTTDLLLGCFAGRKEDIVRLVHFLKDNSFMFDIWSRGYYSRIVRMVNTGTIREVRRLFVYTKSDELSTPESKRLLEFHARQPGYDYRVISYADFMKFCRDLRTNEDGSDFGIYGDWYVYNTRIATAERIEGVFAASEMSVQRFVELFDNCWNHGMHSPKVSAPPMTVYELFEGKAPPDNLSDSK